MDKGWNFMQFLVKLGQIYTSNEQNLAIIIAVLLIAFVVLILLYSHASKVDRNYHDRVERNINTVRIFVIDDNKNQVITFDRSRIRNKKIYSLDQFFRQFNPDEYERLKQWISDLLDPTKKTTSYLEVDVLVRNEKANYFSLLQVQKADTINRRIFIESYLLRYMAPRNKVAVGGQTPMQQLTDEAVKDIFENSKTNQKGMTTLFRFYRLNKRTEGSEEVEKLLLTQFKDRIYPYLNSHRFLKDLAENEIGIFDIKTTSKVQTLQIAHSINADLLRYIDVNGYKDIYAFSIGIVENRDFIGSYRDVIKTAREMSILAEKEKNHIVFFDKFVAKNQVDSDLFVKEVEAVIKNKNFAFEYRPIIDVTALRTYGYMSFVRPYNSLFSTMEELKEYASKTGHDKDIFGITARNLISRFYNEKDGNHLQLFFPLHFSDIDHAIETLPRINHIKELKLMLLFDEDDLLNFVKININIAERIELLKQKNVNIGLIIKDKELPLGNENYKIFNCFVFDNKMTKNIRSDQRSRVYLSYTLGKLIKYNQPIIVSDIETWNGIELMIKSGINLISSNEISPTSEMILPIEKKKLARLKTIGVYKQT